MVVDKDNEFLDFAPLLDQDSALEYSNEDEKLPLPQLLAKIIAQRGSFLDISEDRLKEEIENEQLSKDTASNQGDVEMEGEPLLTREQLRSYEEFKKVKQEIVNSVHSALNESSLSLDFVSLLISCVRPAAGSSSMSPHLKQHIKIGSLSSDKVDPPEDTEKLQFDTSKVGRGWKLESLERAAANLKSSSLRLKEEVEKEKNFWSGMVEVLKSNEVITSMNIKNSKEVCVKYGYGDAGSTYYDKGIGILKKDTTTGDLFFENSAPAKEEKQDKVVNVRIYEKNGETVNLIGESNVEQRLHSFKEKKGVINDIAKARFFLFEEELFYQLLREAATLISLQVSAEEDKIVIDLHDEIIEITEVPPEEVHAPADLPSNERADLIQIYLRLMLYAEHKRNLDQRNIPPLALDTEAQSAPQTSLLSLIRPIIVYNRHKRTLKSVRDVLESIILNHFENDRTKTKEHLAEHLNIINHCNEPSARSKDPFARVSTPPASILELATNSLIVRVKLTSLFASAYSVMNLTLQNQTGSTVLDVTLNDVRELEDCLNWAIRNYDSI
ncbi:hypothetical protein KL936_003639 [Ogataea polymorpha]|uniref:uncharacterized protein n=1 Tax=Ogataea polymorpha TaxID=460523 RepID=UPI0007F33E8E|nr:uncharacterized protein OGAPODRAFT_92988 [Ogataea polymorpha]KAG7888427.1 hypothetical protein KL936_003639 [Ogataea polymorpha]KAG7935657.1 hypothetical protein KL934_002216 [Ogataea polymorpha]OBA17754.1 hypothetical protein OGAPODRAFT_92988 [Ogataea polymorpha]